MNTLTFGTNRQSCNKKRKQYQSDVGKNNIQHTSLLQNNRFDIYGISKIKPSFNSFGNISIYLSKK